jgi:hypothetical protein
MEDREIRHISAFKPIHYKVFLAKNRLWHNVKRIVVDTATGPPTKNNLPIGGNSGNLDKSRFSRGLI